MNGQNLHRRKASKDGEENMVLETRPIDFDEPLETPIASAPPPPRNRVHSSPGHSRSVSAVGVGGIPSSAGPFRPGFSLGRPPNGNSLHPASASPYRTSFAHTPLPEAPHTAHPGHSRNRSVSAFSPSVSSPLASSFSQKSSAHYPLPPPISVSQSAPDLPPASKGQRHRRIHSRNLSVFFPRPGSLPQTSISEDGGQDIEVPIDIEAPAVEIPSAQPAIDFPSSRNGDPPTPLKAGFTFGGRPPSVSGGLPTPEPMNGRTMTTSTSRRGHHHKHSMSHNFFSFLEPGANIKPQSEDSLTTPQALTPVSPWTPMSAFPQSAKSTTETFQKAESLAMNGHSHHHNHDEEFGGPPLPLPASFLQFVLGAWLWVCGQQIGSLSVTGLGYWVVFDGFGVALGSYLPQRLGLRVAAHGKTRMRRSYGNAPVVNVFMFAHAVYLMFSSVYVCKETVEHILLSAGGEEGHHHHHGDEDSNMIGIAFPTFMILLTVLTLTFTSFVYSNHTKLVNVTGNRLPRFSTMLRSLSSRSAIQDPPPSTPVEQLLSNPFTASPLLFSIIIVMVSILAPAAHHRTCDLLLAGLITIITFRVAYRACVVLGTVLLQTSPARGAVSGKMEAFLRAMREVERHPQVLHLPAPHIWQLSPSPSVYLPQLTKGRPEAIESLVVTMELHVKHDLGDDDVLNLTRWAWEKCASALGSKSAGGIGAEVTVGVIRG